MSTKDCIYLLAIATFTAAFGIAIDKHTKKKPHKCCAEIDMHDPPCVLLPKKIQDVKIIFNNKTYTCGRK